MLQEGGLQWERWGVRCACDGGKWFAWLKGQVGGPLSRILLRESGMSGQALNLHMFQIFF